MTQEGALGSQLAGKNRVLSRRIRSYDRYRKQAAEARRMAKLRSDAVEKLEEDGREVIDLDHRGPRPVRRLHDSKAATQTGTTQSP